MAVDSVLRSQLPFPSQTNSETWAMCSEVGRRVADRPTLAVARGGPESRVQVRDSVHIAACLIADAALVLRLPTTAAAVSLLLLRQIKNWRAQF